MSAGAVSVAGLVVPSSDPLFLATVALHVPLGLTAAVTGAVAMLSRKGRGRHSGFGTVYVWCLASLTATAAALAAMRWAADGQLFLIGAAAMVCAVFGRTAMRRRWPQHVRLHIAGMGASYVLMLVAFYVDNGHQLPLWRNLPPAAYWLVPTLVGLPLIGWALLRHPLARTSLPRA